MKRIAYLMVLLVFFLTPGISWGESKIIVDNKVLSQNQSTVMLYNRILVPLRSISTALGAEVRFTVSNQTIDILKEDKHITLCLGSAKAFVNENPYILELEPQFIKGSTYVPLRFVSEALGAQVFFDQTSGSVIINSKKQENILVKADLAKIHYLDVGYGDCTYIDLPGDADILIDGGSAEKSSDVINYLKNQGVKDIELLIATHPHEDHIGAIPEIIKAFPVKEVIDNGVVTSHAYYQKYKQAVWSLRNRNPNIGKIWRFGDSVLETIVPPEHYFADYNNSSLGVKLTIGDIKFFFAGDFEQPVEQDIKGNIQSQFLKVGHHGSNDASSYEFIERVKPAVAVISVGQNSYGFPSSKVIERLQHSGAKVYRTDLNGNIVVTTDGKSYTVVTSKGKEMETVTNPASDVIPVKGEVVASDESNFYHKPDCTLIKNLNVENQIWFSNSLEARGKGFYQCSECEPE
ncbi:Metallo-beta-lactamase superfamily protein [Desulforamulus putei DSM 12395]|uniref:Metallo-beta-lactamase superfamily protein n=1 Tax=Desulforamulus putei DSM 12395 TaxID=1121429 RepID=A0A1M4XSS3_9FIRM|nr:stalk domain-containing protein [Desulforamulus putei]SHE96450.1 Metallo-beta-lactamase superfamily protein [Desulforamulus putei DSM 12395]